MKLVFAAPSPTPSCTDTLWQWVGTSRLYMQDQQPRVRQNENQNKKKFFFNLEKKLETSIQTYCLSVYKCSWFSASQHILGVIFCRS